MKQGTTFCMGVICGLLVAIVTYIFLGDIPQSKYEPIAYHVYPHNSYDSVITATSGDTIQITPWLDTLPWTDTLHSHIPLHSWKQLTGKPTGIGFDSSILLNYIVPNVEPVDGILRMDGDTLRFVPRNNGGEAWIPDTIGMRHRIDSLLNNLKIMHHQLDSIWQHRVDSINNIIDTQHI
jgi:hypothetical protein